MTNSTPMPSSKASRLALLRDRSLICFAALAALLEGPAQLVGLIAVILCLIQVRWSRQDIGWAEIALLVWLLAGVPGLLFSDSAVKSSEALKPLACLLFLAGRATPSTRKDLMEKIAWAFTAAIVLNGAYGVMQVFVVNPPLEQLVLTRTASQHFVDPENPGRLMMASGLFYNRIKLAHVGIVGLATLCAMTISTSPRTVRLRPLLVLSIVILGTAIYLSYRRAAPVALCGAFLVWALLVRRKRILAFGTGVSVLFGAAFFMMQTGRARLEAATGSLDERILIYRSALNLAADNPLFGVGHGAYRQSVGSYATSNVPEVILNLQSQAHNVFLHTLTETGLIGLIAFVLVILISLLRVSRRLRAAEDTTRVTTDQVAFLAVIILLLIGMLHFVLYHNPVALVFWYCLGLCAGSWPTKDDERSEAG